MTKILLNNIFCILGGVGEENDWNQRACLKNSLIQFKPIANFQWNYDTIVGYDTLPI